ncbi:GIN domain-containing protein [Aquimarina sediminis]|uniref:GIN domain-containing protein n=1 Tax=Aquimarina sediminis TaxID=2070536 RepID=UPI000CA00F00|nr:DUF2807 domain-containing protein [Aquimarina sediminis]
MKTSNKILLGILCAIIFFFSAFQFSIHGYVKKIASENNINEISNEIVSEVRSNLSFRKISVNDGIQVFFRQDTISQIKVEAPKNLLPYIKTEVKNKKLIISKTEKKKEKDTVRVFISNDKLDSLKVSSRGYFETVTIVSGKDLELEFSNNSKGRLELSYESVTCVAVSGAKVKLTGDSKKIDFSN